MNKIYRYIKHIIFSVLGGGLPVSGCRFQPSCSQYCRTAIHTHGWLHGMPLCFKRLSRCHPLSSQSGLDPVPERR